MLKKNLDKFVSVLREMKTTRRAKKGADENQEKIDKILKTLKDGKSGR